MARTGWISFALVAALATSARAEDAYWARKPNGQDFENYYPERAAADRQSGEVLMSCRVAADGGLVDCRVEREAPARYDFGAAARAMAPLFRLADGRPGAGRVYVDVTFAYPGGTAFLLRAVPAPPAGVGGVP